MKAVGRRQSWDSGKHWDWGVGVNGLGGLTLGLIVD